MYNVSVPLSMHHSFITSAMNSLPLSLRIFSGAPRIAVSSSSSILHDPKSLACIANHVADACVRVHATALQGVIRIQTLEPDVLALQFFQALHRVALGGSVFRSPSMQRHQRHAKRFCDIFKRLPCDNASSVSRNFATISSGLWRFLVIARFIRNSFWPCWACGLVSHKRWFLFEVSCHAY